MNSEKGRQTWLFNEKGSVLVKDNKDSTKPMKTRTNPLVWLFKENPFYFAAFFLPVLILFVSYLLFGIYPFGERSVLSLDLNGQYVYYFDYMYDVFRGNQSIFYSWSRSLSGEFFGILGYYLASPFNFLVWLFPREYITEGILTMLLAKVGTIGVTMAIYLKRGRGCGGGTAVVFSMMYALCAYVIVQTMNPMWLDGVLALPLVIYGVESLVRHGRFRLLVISLFYSFVTCFYIGYMIGIFTALYFICYLISSRLTDASGVKTDSGAVLARIGLFAVSAATAVLMASFVLIPVYSSLQQGKTDFTQPFRTAEGEFNTEFLGQTNFILADFARKLFPNTYDTVRNDSNSLPDIYSGTLALLMLPLFFFAGKENVISIKRRATGAVLALFLIISMYYTPIDTVLHGMQIPNWLPFRYSFMLSFLLVAWGAEVFDKLREFSRRAIGISALGIFGLLVYFESRDTFDAALGENGRELFDNAAVVIPALLILVVLTIILLCNKNKRFGKTALAVTIGVAVALELFHNTYTNLNKQDEDITYSDRATYVDFVVPLRNAVKDITLADDGLYRMEKTFHRTVNDPLALEMFGLSHSASTFNEGAVTLLGKLGMTSRGHYTRYSGATPLINDLFGVRYVLSHSSYSYGRPLEDGILSIRHNENALPVAYLTDMRLADFSFDEFPSDDVQIFRRQNRLLSTMLGETRVNEYFRVINNSDIEKISENIIEGGTNDGHFSYHAVSEYAVAAGNARIIYSMTAEADGRIFMWLPSAHERRASVTVQRKDEEGAVTRNDWRSWYFEYDDYCIADLGEFSEGENFSVTLTLLRDDFYYRNAYFAYMDTGLYGEAIAELHALNAQTAVTGRSPTNLRIDVFADTERLLFTTIPAEPGWTVTIDGVPTDYITVLDALIGIRLPAGKHVVELKFTTAGYPIALFLSGGGILIFALLCILYLKMRKAGVLLSAESGQTAAGGEELPIEFDEGFEFEIAEEAIKEEEPLFTPFTYGVAPSEAPPPLNGPPLDGDIILNEEEAVPEPVSFMPKSFFEEEPDEQLTVDNEELTVEEEPDEQLTVDNEELTIDDEQLIVEEEPDEQLTVDNEELTVEEEQEEEQNELILGSDESFESIAADFAEINEEPVEGDDDNFPEEPDIEIDDGFLPVPEVELNFEPEEEPDIAIDDIVAPEIEMQPDAEEGGSAVPQEDIKLDDLSVPDFFFEPEPEPEPEEPELESELESEPELEEAEPPPPPPTLGQIDFAARRRALELELMQQREDLEQSFSGDISDTYEEEFEITELVPAEEARPVISESEAAPVFTFEEDMEDFLVAGNNNNVPSSEFFDEESEPEPEPEKSEPTLHTPAPWDVDDIFGEFEFIMADETEFVGTFEEVAEEEINELPPVAPPSLQDDDEDIFIPPFGPGTL
ncbi:MAG: YfhO family protein [Oscillospiraceae bacterium]|jgi:uncharacterized membrane protein YfhO|nr:YfhO family protein [Oscillospiraceae bacterium]